jgi:MFS family permease
MKTAKRLLLGIVLGAFLGTAFAGLLLRLSPIQQNLADISLILEWDFGRFYADHIYTVVTSAGAIIGTIIGGSLVVSKWWAIAVLSLFAGMAIGGAAVYFTETKVVNRVSDIWEDTADAQRAFGYLMALRAIDQAGTNQAAIIKFQATGRDVLAGYIQQTKSRAQNWKGRKPVDFIFTNSVTYHNVQKYLATHTNSFPADNDF